MPFEFLHQVAKLHSGLEKDTSERLNIQLTYLFFIDLRVGAEDNPALRRANQHLIWRAGMGEEKTA
ncbi:MAG TPA: hypothetical protein P5279_10530 [Anaerohalosphaeraceae bacterium]|nr:hypothetical protein [Anaerohalosphaeraceae bacterium]HRT50921.1 hypothetical protein [Anaerohalosphaeraceae bacterium]HRT86618.1 hypothetical protein [Anaerohalosphaeraceae bacterium]